MKVGKDEIDKIMEEIEESLATVTDAERAYWRLSQDEREQLPQLLRVWFDTLYR